MLDPYKRLISIILFGISIVNYFKLIDLNESKMNDLTYFALIIVIVTILAFLVIKKYSEIKICQPNVFTIGFILIVDSVFIKSLIDGNIIDNYIIIIFTFLVLLALNISLIFELSD